VRRRSPAGSRHELAVPHSGRPRAKRLRDSSPRGGPASRPASGEVAQSSSGLWKTRASPRIVEANKPVARAHPVDVGDDRRADRAAWWRPARSKLSSPQMFLFQVPQTLCALSAIYAVGRQPNVSVHCQRPAIGRFKLPDFTTDSENADDFRQRQPSIAVQERRRKCRRLTVRLEPHGSFHRPAARTGLDRRSPSTS
jgi:hypothetical protein